MNLPLKLSWIPLLLGSLVKCSTLLRELDIDLQGTPDSRSSDKARYTGYSLLKQTLRGKPETPERVLELK